MIMVLCLLAFASFAQAQATRTWVSGVGDDVNPCSRTAPCKTFAGAISKTAINGEIDALDPGGFGTLTITKSINLDGCATLASILASGTNGINVNLTDVSGNDPLHLVRLRCLSINGAGSSGVIGTRTGIQGINVLVGAGIAPTVIVEDSVIDGFGQNGINWKADGGDLIVKNCSIRNNGIAGIVADSQGARIVHVSVDGTHTDFNQQGIRFEDNVLGSIRHSVAGNNTLNGFVCFPQGGPPSEMNIDLSMANDNKQFGIFVGGINSTGIVRITGDEITNNTSNGLNIADGGTICSNGKNHITTPTMAPSLCFNDQ